MCLAVCVVFFANIILAQGQENPQTNNVLIILADDLGVDYLAAYGLGSDVPATPNIDALAQSGVLFRSAWANPVCSPTRATIQTGRYGFRTGIGTVSEILDENSLPLTEITLPEMLDLGTGGIYSHAVIGKWHLAGNSVGWTMAPLLAGYSHFSGTMENIHDPDTYYSWPKVVNGVESVSTVYATTDNVNDALSWIGSVSQPWLCYLAFNTPHHPWHTPPSHLHSVDLSGAGDPNANPRPYFKAMIEAMDTEMGRLFAGLGNQLANTTIIFLGDNGTATGLSLPPFNPQRAKHTLFDGGIHVPLIVSGPFVQQPGSESNALINTSDIFATVADIAGVDLNNVLPVDHAIDSVSMLPYLSNPAAPSLRKTIFAEKFYPNIPTRGIRFPLIPPGPDQCQTNEGYGDVGGPVLEICGGTLVGSTQAQVFLSNAPKNQAGKWYWSVAMDVTQPRPILAANAFQLVPFTTNAVGEFSFSASLFSNGLIPGTIFMQMEVNNPAQPGTIVVSNVVRAILPTSVKAIRNEQYKLMVRPAGVLTNVYGTLPELLFDLAADPFELNNLLASGSLTPEQSAAYDFLKQELRELIRPMAVPAPDQNRGSQVIGVIK